MLTLQQQAHHFAHRMAMCQPLAPKQTATIPKPSFVYLANDEIYPEPQKPLIPTPFEPDMLIVATNFKKFSTASAETQSEEAVHVVREENPTGALFRDKNRRLWVSHYGVADAIKKRAGTIIKKQDSHKSTEDQRSLAKTVRRLLLHEKVLEEGQSTNNAPAAVEFLRHVLDTACM